MSSVELSPRPPANSGAMVICAPGQGDSSTDRSITTEVADSAAGCRLFLPEYGASNAGCACVATVA